MPTALITGITGQDGSYLAEYLLEKGYQVVGMVRRASTETFDRIQHFQDEVSIIQGDLHDQSSLVNLLDDHQPSEIYNLAAQSFVPTSWNQPVLTGEVTGLGVTRMLDAIKIVNRDIRFYQASSSEMFGKVSQVPQTESTPFHPRSAYGISKVAGFHLTRNYREAYGIKASSGILYNHESPRRGFEFVTRKITSHAVRIKLGLAKEVKLGNIEARRDWGHARDYVRAMWLMLQQEKPEDYVIATGNQYSVREFADAVFSYLGLDYRDHVVIDPQFLRPADVETLVGDATKAKQNLGWSCQVDFKALVQEMVEADLRIAAGSL